MSLLFFESLKGFQTSQWRHPWGEKATHTSPFFTDRTGAKISPPHFFGRKKNMGIVWVMCYVRLDLAHQPYYQKELQKKPLSFSTHITPKKTMTRAQWCLTPQGIHSFIHSWLHQKNNSVLFPISAFLPGSSLGTWQEGMSWTWEACLAA